MSKKATAWVSRPNGTIAELTSEGPGEVIECEASDLSVGADGTVWVVTNQPIGAGEDETPGAVIQFKKAKGKKWETIAAQGATRIEGGPKGAVAYIVDADGTVLKLDTKGKAEAISSPHFAREVSVGIDGTVWIISDDGVHGGAAVHFYDGKDWKRLPEDITATKVGAADKGVAYLCNAFGQLSKVDTDGNEDYLSGEGFAREVSVDPNGNVWVVTFDHDEDGGNKVICQIGGEGAWQDVEGGALRIDA